MFKLFKHTGKEKWQLIKSFKTFDDALKFANEKIIPISYHETTERDGEKVYWFADNNQPDKPFNGYIEYPKSN